MKKFIRHTLALLAIGTALPAAGLFAQAPAPASTPSVSVPAADTRHDRHDRHRRRQARRRKMRERLAILTPEERQKFMAAHQKAMQDPAVKAAEATRATDKKGFHKAMREAMLRADPSVGPILEKLRENRPGKKERLIADSGGPGKQSRTRPTLGRPLFLRPF